MARPEKVAEVEAIAASMTAAKAIVLTDFSGCTVEQMTIFREKCRESGIQTKVVKNRLARIAADNVELPAIKDHLKGPTALMFGLEGQVDAAKVAVDFQKENEAFGIKGGILDGAFLDVNEVVALSKIPSMDELIAKMMGSINSPASGLVGTINGVAGKLCRAIDAVAKQKAESAA